MNPRRVLRWISGAMIMAGLLLGLLALTASPWLRIASGGRTYGIRFSLVADLVRVGRQSGSPFPTPANVYFGWASWVLLAGLTLGAALSGLRLPRAEIVAGVTAAASIVAIALLVAACRPLVTSQGGIGASSGPWLAALSYVLLGAAAVLGAMSGSREPRRSEF